jgi:hypothetical protein
MKGIARVWVWLEAGVIVGAKGLGDSVNLGANGLEVGEGLLVGGRDGGMVGVTRGKVVVVCVGAD